MQYNNSELSFRKCSGLKAEAEGKGTGLAIILLICKVQRNRNNYKEYPILRNIPIPFTRIGIELSNIPILFNRSRIAFLNILYLQNFYRILQNMKMQESELKSIIYSSIMMPSCILGKWAGQLKRTDLNLSFNVQIQTRKKNKHNSK